MTVIDIDFDTLMIIMIGLFAISGFLRGWWHEGLTTIVLVLLVIFLTQPELANQIIEFINNILRLISTMLQSGFNLEPGAISAAAAEPSLLELDPNDRSTYIVILVVMVLLSYFVGKITLGGVTYTYGGRILGGILGAINGFIAVNLVKEFIVGRFFPETGLTAQSAAPQSVSMAISDVPPENVLTGAPLLLIIAVGVLVLFLVVIARMPRKDGQGIGIDIFIRPTPPKKA
jgi:hypothetical protein